MFVNGLIKNSCNITYEVKWAEDTQNWIIGFQATVQFLRKLVCKIARALHEQENIRCMLACALEVDDVSIAHEKYTHLLRA